MPAVTSRLIRLLLVAIVAVLAVAAPALAEDNPPLLLGGTVSPTSLDANGGQATITVRAIDDYGIFMAYADVFASGDTGQSVQLIRSGEDEFTGVVNLPPNATANPLIYGVTVTVTDFNGGFDTKPVGEITVAAPVAATGLLRLSPATATFGAVRVGRVARRTVLIRHGGTPGDGPITGKVVAGGPFTVPGDGSFRVEAGETARVAVSFAPRSAGLVTRILRVRRDDGKQAGLSTRLVGFALPR